MRYELRSLAGGWTVWDALENTPAVTNDVSLIDLSMKAAADLAEILNGMERETYGRP